ncbi:MAG: MarR family winged helix-turn-helix transcriptional regulator [Acidimicrobiia bacterium]|nr:MarR family transcriptional regulator [Acidimicrobiia bacterium]MDQ3500741.1 MarR family transcriptional regulator [Actinomycetota bacterium]
MKTKLSEHELRAWQALLHAHHEVTRKLGAELRAKHGISFEAYDVLLRLARAPDHALQMTELARRVMAPPSTLTRRVDRLVSQGLVDRDRLGHDSRAMLARLTEYGRQVLRRAAQTHLRGIREHYTGRLTDKQLRDVASALEVITGPHQPH